ncbi:DUF1090 family protein [Serratia proteamaculans]|uniref:DUF1090 family protein n=1 Tax=Serratia proteamaculans TaxID=28151 RepID=A0A5Q2VDB2_SERPR|nr:DUF1090 family protein [Serratia proteamaculans]QGH61995.1 DUF1090 family protein [Serratia proteamaculans]
MNIKKVFCLILFLTTVGITADVEATSGRCEARKEAIQRQMYYAKKYGNTHEMAGLERALSEVTRNCSDLSSRRSSESDIRRKERAVSKLRHALQAAEAELDEARFD